ncbi:hypothetical protein [Halorubrum sp. N11]|uniref:hypothetical protein n=1 Tax=Halorubrum sp. N11 TaxID=3402276 RepID=UPI003EBDD7D9
MSNFEIDYRLYLSVLFLVVAVAAVQIKMAEVPSGPWEGLYRSFPLFWSFIIIALTILLRITVFGPTEVKQYMLYAVPLLTVLVAVPTLKWGVPYGIRDPWIHLDLIKSESITQDNMYPMLHSLFRIIAELSDVPPRELLSRVQVVGPGVGAIWLITVVRRINPSSWHVAGLALFPVCYMWFISRPYTVAPLIVLLVWWVVVNNSSDWKHHLLLILFIIVSVWWHPVAGIINGFVLLSAVLTWKLIRIKAINSVFQTITPSRERLAIISGIVLVVVLIHHLIYNTTVVEATLSRAFIITSGGSEGNSPVVVGNISDKIFEALRRTMFVLAIGFTSFVTLITQLKQRRIDQFLLMSIIATAILGMVFLGLDLLPGLAFGVRRANTLAPLLLVPAGAIVFRESSTSSRRLLIAFLILSTGVAVAYSSPIIGGAEGGSTMSDVQSVKWLHSYQGNSPVVGSENTIYIAQGIYGDKSVDTLTNGQRFRYQSIKRQYRHPWTYDQNLPDTVEETYVVLSKQHRVSIQSEKKRQDLQSFVLRTDRVYSNGNVWVHKDNN